MPNRKELSTIDPAGDWYAQRLTELESDFLAKVDDALAPLQRLFPRKAGRYRTVVLAIATANSEPNVPKKSVLNRPDTVRSSVYYDPRSNWWHNDDYRKVQTAVDLLFVEYKTHRHLLRRQYLERLWDERLMSTAERLLAKVDDGVDLPFPEKWSLGDLARLAEAAVALGDRSLSGNGPTPGEVHEHKHLHFGSEPLDRVGRSRSEAPDFGPSYIETVRPVIQLDDGRIVPAPNGSGPHDEIVVYPQDEEE